MADDANQVDGSQESLSWKQKLFSPAFYVRAIVGLAKKSLLMTILVVVGIAAFLAGIAIVATLSAGGETNNGISVEQALEKLDQEEYLEAKQLAIQLHEQDELSYEDFGVAAYVLGVSTMESAKLQWDAQKIRKTHLLASRYLREAELHGFPQGREADGHYRYGYCQFHSGQLDECIKSLELAIKAKSPQSTDVHRMLADAYFHGSKPDTAKSLENINAFLNSDSLTDQQQHDGLIQKSRLLLATGDVTSAAQTLAQVPVDSVMQARALVAKAMLLMNEGRFDDALAQLVEAIKTDNSTSLARPEASYLLGVCHQRKGEFDSANERFSDARRRNFSSPIAIAAGLGEAESLRSLGDHDEAVKAYVRLLEDAGESDSYANRWLPLDEFRQRLNEAYTFYMSAKMFEHAMQVAEAMGDVFTPSESLELMASAIQGWAAEDAGSTLTADDEQAANARKQFRLAGRLFERLSELRIATRNYTDDIWQSADSYLNGRDYKSAVRMIKKYMQNAPRNRMSRAQVALGEAKLALNELDDALQPLLNCINLTPNDPVSYRARLLAGQIYEEQGDLTSAKDLLIANMQETKLEPDSIEWRDSELALGKLQHREATILEAQSRVTELSDPKKGMDELEQSYNAFQEAILTLDDFKRRNEKSNRRWATPVQFTEARYLLADAHRQAAKFPRKKMKTAVGTTKATLNREKQTELQLANQIYERLETDLRRREDNNLLGDVEWRVLRNCYFGRGDVLFDMQRYEEAIRVYSSARNRYPKRPEILEAYVQISNCYRRLNRINEAQGTLNQAIASLKQMPPEADFTETTRYDREQWTELLGWLKTL